LALPELDKGIQKLESANITRKLVENGAGQNYKHHWTKHFSRRKKLLWDLLHSHIKSRISQFLHFLMFDEPFLYYDCEAGGRDFNIPRVALVRE